MMRSIVCSRIVELGLASSADTDSISSEATMTVRHSLAHPAPTSDRGERTSRASAGNDLQEIIVGEQRGIFEDGNTDRFLNIMRKSEHDLLGHAIERFDFGGKNGAHARQLIARQTLKGLQREFANTLALGGE